MTNDTIDTPQERRNVEALKRAIEAYNRHDPEGYFALMDKNVRFGIAAAPEHFRFGGVGKGIAWAKKVIKEIADEFEWITYQCRDIIAERDWVIALNGGKIRDRASGAVLDADLVDVIRFKNGKIVHFVEYFDTAILTARATARAKVSRKRGPKAAARRAARSKAPVAAKRK